ncbi:GAF domain-containing protein [Terrabacter sp. Ter38]|uniref:GAF domain-containing protein n=1 Tax=Terrabacter sp. Ter38 TaxID=2926030 RepID=UPI0021196D47|nr:GAF domain-containing protein [Terrabacter sp. Ter38]
MTDDYVGPDPHHRAAMLAALTRGIARDVDRLPLPARLCNAFVDVFGGAGAAITLGYHQPDRLTLCATDPTVARLDGLQEVLGEGPGWDAFTSRRVVTADLREPTPWEHFSSTARQELGELWVCAAPMRPDDRALGVVMVYDESAEAVAGDPVVAQFLADALGAALLGHNALLTDDVGPWVVRQQVHQAVGMVVAQLGIQPVDAMAVIRAHAYTQGTTVEAIAALVLDRTLDFTDTGPTTKDPA